MTTHSQPTTPDYVTARTPNMRGIWLAIECGHLLYDAGRPATQRCTQCDPTFEVDMPATWVPLFMRAEDRARVDRSQWRYDAY